ncbi:hypothetical protein GCM10010207_88140 [Streptomyces atratus]|nr:hypothetical protein GCM10010207_88140 [Streptomyces atratus]
MSEVFRNLAITGLSIAVAFLIGTIELVNVLHGKIDLRDSVVGWISGPTRATPAASSSVIGNGPGPRGEFTPCGPGPSKKGGAAGRRVSPCGT